MELTHEFVKVSDDMSFYEVTVTDPSGSVTHRVSVMMEETPPRVIAVDGHPFDRRNDQSYWSRMNLRVEEYFSSK